MQRLDKHQEQTLDSTSRVEELLNLGTDYRATACIQSPHEAQAAQPERRGLVPGFISRFATTRPRQGSVGYTKRLFRRSQDSVVVTLVTCGGHAGGGR